MINLLIEKIIQNPRFLRLKNVVENSSYHDHEDVYSHVLKVKDIALREIDADFIENQDAKDKFWKFINEDLQGFKRKDIMILIALLHDIGKILHVKEGVITHPLLVTNEAGIAACPGHEYWGSTKIGEFVKDLQLSKDVIDYMASIIKLHDTFGEQYFEARKNLSWDLLINDVKSRAEGFYKEALFNIYCDCFTAKPFEKAKEMIVRIFNEPKLYERREYVFP